MHHQPRSDIDTATAVHGAIGRLIARGVQPRDAVHRAARKYRLDPKQAAALIAGAQLPNGRSL